MLILFRSKRSCIIPGCSLLIALAATVTFAAHPHEDINSSRILVDDRVITIHSSSELQARREKLIRYLWGRAGLPADRLPVSVEKGAVHPVNLKNLKRVDTLHIAMDGGLKGVSHHFLPLRNSNNRLVILHLGHTDNCTFNDNVPGEPDIGMRRTISRLLVEGYGVLGVYMPRVTPEDCSWEHDQLLTLRTTGSPMKYFMEPTLASLNYLNKYYPGYRSIAMIGLSGGGWTTTLYAAIDPRIKVSIPVAGSLPLYLRYGTSRGDAEQYHESFYRIAGYPELYLLGAQGRGRRQLQILNRHDDCCFGENQHDTAAAGIGFEPAVRTYEKKVQSVLKRIGPGSFQIIFDEQATSHQISAHALEHYILPALRGEPSK